MARVKLCHLYTIAYRQEHLETKNEGYEILDNLKNERSDWREYWPIRRFLLTEKLDEECYYGFFSPRFYEKTGLTYADVAAFVHTAPADVEVVTFSPQVDIGAFFANVFIGGELADPGFLDTCQTCARVAGIDADLCKLFMDSRTTVFSNYFLARPSFWRRWLAACEPFFAVAEGPDSELRRALVHKTSYREGVERKVFVVEGMVSLLLTTDRSIRVLPYDSFKLGWSAQLHHHRHEAIVCDALKMALREQGHEEYAQAYYSIADSIINDTFRKPTEQRPLMKQTPAHDLYNDTILEMLPQNCKTVVEVGCMRGSLTRAYLARNPACQWTGIDIDPDNVAIAAGVCQRALCRDIETMAEAEFAQFAAADAWVFGDTLEHLRDPWVVLARIRNYLPARGVVVASIPNAQHWSFQARVNAGLFRYEDDGLFDRTHLRFFTRTTILEMFRDAGYRVDQAVSRNLSSPDAAKYIGPIRAMAQASGVDPDIAERDAMAFQYVVRAMPAA